MIWGPVKRVEQGSLFGPAREIILPLGANACAAHGREHCETCRDEYDDARYELSRGEA